MMKRKRLKRSVVALSPLWDLLSAPLVLAASLILKLVRSYGLARLPVVRGIFWRLGVLAEELPEREPGSFWIRKIK